MNHVIGIDWGTTNGRAYLIDEGEITDRRNLEVGALLPADKHAQVLSDKIGDWLDQFPSANILLCGMVGAREGWAEAGYLECPANPSDLTELLTNVLIGNRSAFIIPGLKYSLDAATGFDVMRGEEIQVFGALSSDTRDKSVFCLPGTHSKWVRGISGQVDAFRTYMTGDIFSAVCRATILSKTIGALDTENHDAFCDGVRQTRKGGAFSSDLFTARTRVLAGVASIKDQAAYISGLTIGHEIRDATARFDAEHVTIIGDKKLTELYVHALRIFGCEAVELSGKTCVGRGLWQLSNSISQAQK